MIGYDNLAIHHQLILDLPFREAVQAITYDVAKPHHKDVMGNFTWASLASGLGVISLDGAAEYLDEAAAECADLAFTSENYSLGIWILWETIGTDSVVMGRYVVDNDGWELYLTPGAGNNYLTLRHHHVSLAPDLRSACYSENWTQGVWWLMGVSRDGATPRMYRNGVAVDVTCDASGLRDADAAARDLVIGTRCTKNAQWVKGKIWRPRIWSGRALTEDEWKHIFDTEKHWFGL